MKEKISKDSPEKDGPREGQKHMIWKKEGKKDGDQEGR